MCVSRARPGAAVGRLGAVDPLLSMTDEQDIDVSEVVLGELVREVFESHDGRSVRRSKAGGGCLEPGLLAVVADLVGATSKVI